LQKIEPGLGRHGVACLQYKSVVVGCQQQDFLCRYLISSSFFFS
jgi:hypothetical protein